MSQGRQLAVAVVLADLLVEAIERGAVPGDGTPDGQLIADLASFAGDHAGADDLDETRDRLLRPTRTTSDRIAATFDWVSPIHRALDTGRELPDSLAGPTAAVRELSDADDLWAAVEAGDLLSGTAGAVFGRAAADAGAAAAARGDLRDAVHWQWLASAAGHPGAATALPRLSTFTPSPPKPPRPDRDAAAAALLNASGLSLGYAYLGRPGRTLMSLAITGVLFLFATAGRPADHVTAWFTVAGIWLGAMAVDGYRQGRRSPQLTARSYRRPRLAGVLVLVLMVAGFAGYRAEGRRELAAARAAYHAGDCASAIDRYNQVRSRFELALTAVTRTAETEVRECRSLLAAELALRDQDHQLAVGRFDSQVAAYPDGLLLGRAQAGRAAAYYGRAGYFADLALQGGPAVSGVGYLRRAIDDYNIVATTFSASPESPRVPQAVAGLYERVVKLAAGGPPCDAIATIEFLSAAKLNGGPAFAPATELLAQTMYRCGVAKYDEGAFAAAQTQLEVLAVRFPGHPRTAETRDMIIWASIGAAHKTYPPKTGSPGASGRAPRGTALVEVVNGSPSALTILYHGPVTGTVTVPACPSCTTQSMLIQPLSGPTCGTSDSPTVTLRLAPGSYQVVLRNSASTSATPYTASWQLRDATAYGTCFYQSIGFGFGR